jgi:hypothetical protein
MVAILAMSCATPVAPSEPPSLSYEALMGCHYTLPPADPTAAPTLKHIPLPDFPGRYAIWGAVSRDRRGHIWVGVSAQGVTPASAHLFEYIPEKDTLVKRGDVVEQLKRLDRLRPKEQQMKIHSRFVHASDGYLYFSSMDEEGEDEKKLILPTWGGHLWRLKLDTYTWEHLRATPEPLIAVTGAGKNISTMGYFNHIVYSFNTETKEIQKVAVGAAGGHVSRHIFADDRGHVYVPRTTKAGKEFAVSLVEFDAKLKEIAQTPLKNYTVTLREDSHGLLTSQPLADRSIAFGTDQGYLYRVIPPKDDGPAKVEELGWFHPKGKQYVATLFTYDGKKQLVGACKLSEKRWDWLTFDLEKRTAKAVPLDAPRVDGKTPFNVLLYGSNVRDNKGCFYMAGTYQGTGQGTPVLYKVVPPK